MLIAVGAAATVLWFWGDAGIHRLTRDHVLTRLQHDTDSIIAALSRNTSGQWSINAEHLGSIFDRVYSGHYYRVFGAGTDLRSRSLWDYLPDQAQLSPGETRQARSSGPENQELLTWSHGIRKAGDNLTVWLAEDIQPLDSARRLYSLMAGAVLMAIIAFLIASQQWILTRAFAHLDNTRAAIRDLRHGRITSLSTDVPSEIEPLVAEINRLLTRLESKVSRSRNAMGNLAHELKRPLSRLRHLGGLLDPEMHRDLIGTIDEFERMVTRELKRARIVGVATPGRHTDLSHDIPLLVDALNRIYPERLILTDFPSNLVLPHDRDDMLELLGNLLDNALKHGSDKVRLTISRDRGGWTLQVTDDGPGIPEQKIHLMLTRGARLDESRAGSGLGLAICADIVREYGGELHLANLEPRGFEVTVHFDHEKRDDEI